MDIHGLSIDRRWRLGEADDTTFTASLTVTNTTGSAVRASFDEPVPAAFKAAMSKARFTPSAPKIADSGAMLEWTLQVSAHGTVTYGYQASLASADTTQAELAQWAGHLRRGGLSTQAFGI
jgi:hypothetical protein